MAKNTNNVPNRRAELRAAQERAAAKARRNRIIIVIIAVVVAAALVAVVALAVSGTFGGSSKDQDLTGTTRPPNASANDKGIYSQLNTNDSAKVLTVVDDFQCPACASYEEVYGPVFQSLAEKGEVKLEYRNRFFLDTNLKNDSSQKAAIGASCADTVGKYQEYHDTVFANQPSQEGTGYTESQLRETFPQQAGITGDDLTTFQTCYDSGATGSYVQGVDDKASADGWNSTPTFLVNGKKISFTDQNPTEDYVMQIVNAA